MTTYVICLCILLHVKFFICHASAFMHKFGFIEFTFRQLVSEHWLFEHAYCFFVYWMEHFLSTLYVTNGSWVGHCVYGSFWL